MMNIRKPYQIMLLWIIVLGVYYPVIFAGLNSVDDQRMLYSLEDSVGGSWIDLFLPSQGFYYRPLLMLTFRLDYLLWGQEVGFYHLENILIHGASATLLFFILRQFLIREHPRHSSNEWPLLGAILFALHPIVTESVNWISGRTDLLGTFFVLAAALVLFNAVLRISLPLVVTTVFLLGGAVVSKEVMVFFIPAAVFLFWRWSVNVPRYWRRQALWTLVLPFLVSGVGFLILRWLRHGVKGDLDSLIHKYHYGAFDTVRVFFKVLGFYGKKILAPLPLNFAIMQVSDLYVGLGVLLFCVAFLLLFLRRPDSDLVLVSWFLILPGILIALTGVAWTPLAERYIYLPSAFFVMGLTLFVAKLQSLRLKKNIAAGIAFLLIPIGMTTANRNFIWQDNTALYADSLLKSPQFAAMNNELAIALVDDGQLDYASHILDSGKRLKTASPLLYINQSRILMLQGNLVGAHDEMMKICSDKKIADTEALKMLAHVDEKRLLHGEDEYVVVPDLIDTYRVLIEKTKYPHLEYRLGQLLLLIGERQEASKYFSLAYKRASVNDFYREAAGRMAKKLSNKEI